MQNNYQGPPKAFAMVVPVPVILREQDVKTLPRGIFDRVDQLAAPRLVEYWERDPCDWDDDAFTRRRFSPSAREDRRSEAKSAGGYGVKIEAEFTVGEYQIVILSAEEATGLDAWLRDNGYTIPEGAAEVLRPYVQAGMKFFVAKVDPGKVTFDAKGQAMLSPLRFHYDADTFNLPVRLGLLNSSGAQDLIVHIVARSRYEVANYPNVTIPTNIEVKDGVRDNFGGFYVSLFDATLAHNPKAVVTEYAWMANNCDPCPVQPLQVNELMTLGADVLPSVGQDEDRGWSLPGQFVLTRLHARYSKDSLGEDLVFREASPIAGGREVRTGDGERVEQGSTSHSINNFQGRYIIRHLWQGAVLCLRPKFGRWGGPPKGEPHREPAVARDLAFADRSANLASYVAQDVPEVRLTVPADVVTTPGPTPSAPPVGAPPGQPPARGCGCAASEPTAGLLLGLAGLRLRRRRG